MYGCITNAGRYHVKWVVFGGELGFAAKVSATVYYPRSLMVARTRIRDVQLFGMMVRSAVYVRMILVAEVVEHTDVSS